MTEIISGAILPVLKKKGHPPGPCFIKIQAKSARDLAKSKGEQFYFTGFLCRRKHSCERYTNNGQCLQCAKLNKIKHKGKYSSKGYYRKNISKIKAKERKLRYGLSDEEYKKMLWFQNNLCAICEKPEKAKSQNGEIRELCVDHCEITKKVRGLLCHQCNIGIGNLYHNADWLRKAALYCEAT